MTCIMVMNGHSVVRDYPWGYFMRQVEAAAKIMKKRK